LPDLYRPTLNLLYGRLITIKDDIDVLNVQITALVKQNVACDRLTKLEGVGPISSVLLYATLGTGEAFANGRQFSAYLGLTPKQYSSGGKTVLIGLSRYVANKRLIDQNLISHLKSIPAYDVIAIDSHLILVGEKGIYQFDYSDPSDLQLLSVIETTSPS